MNQSDCVSGFVHFLASFDGNNEILEVVLRMVVLGVVAAEPTPPPFETIVELDARTVDGLFNEDG